MSMHDASVRRTLQTSEAIYLLGTHEEPFMLPRKRDSALIRSKVTLAITNSADASSLFRCSSKPQTFKYTLWFRRLGRSDSKAVGASEEEANTCHL